MPHRMQPPVSGPGAGGGSGDTRVCVRTRLQRAVNGAGQLGDSNARPPIDVRERSVRRSNSRPPDTSILDPLDVLAARRASDRRVEPGGGNV